MKQLYQGIGKGIILLWFTLTIVVMFSQTAYAKNEKNGWEKGCYYKNNIKQKSTWIKSGKNTYYLDKNGKKVQGWKKIKKNYYFFNQKGNNYQYGRKTGAKITKLSKQVVTMGIDVSVWQGDINWIKLKNTGVDFVMIRLGYGKGRYGSKHCTLDNRFHSYVKGATSVGIPVGVYFYSYATSEKEALAEAEFTISKLDGIPISFPVAYDIEDAYILSHTSKKERTSMAKTYMDTIAAAGYYPMFYMNQTWYNEYIQAGKLKNYDFWYARYTNQEPDREEYPYAMWQATSTQKLSGIRENTVDVDFLYKDYSEIISERNRALKYGWHYEEDLLQYYYQGKKKTDGWFQIAGNTYYLTPEGASIGWKTIENQKFYFDSKGKMEIGLTKIGKKYYYFNQDGSLKMKTDEPGLSIDQNGVCHIKTGWYKDQKGKYFYRLSSGKIAKNKWIKTKSKKYYVGKNGRRTIGLKKIKGKKYYFNKKGEMVRNKTIRIKGKKYTFKKNGQMKDK